MDLTRRKFVNLTATAVLAAAMPRPLMGASELFSISLAQWSLHRSMFGAGLGSVFGGALQTDPDSVLQGEIHPLEFASIARSEFDIDAIEYVNTFFFGHARDEAYLKSMRDRAAGEGVQSLLIMCDAEGPIGAPDAERRSAVVDNHKKWADAAAFLGCRAIRVNAGSEGGREEQQKLAADGLRRLAEYAEQYPLNVLVENHGGLSSDGAWLAGVMNRVDHDLVGTLPDFGNFRVSGEITYDRYRGVEELMPHAKAVSAKSYEFDGEGNETRIDYRRMMRLVLDAGYRGHVGIEYEGSVLGELEGIRATQRLLQRIRSELTSSYTP